MPIATVNDISLHYADEGSGPETILLINGLADDLATWGYQAPDLVAAGYRVVSFDNRGIGDSDTPPGPYSATLLAGDAKALVDELGLARFHLMGVSMGGMIAQEYALAYPDDLASVTFACTYAAPGPFCSRLFAIWEELAGSKGIPFIMREVTLWAFTLDFFEERGEELTEVENGMAALDMSVEAYLAQLAVIQTHDTTTRISGLAVPSMVIAGQEDILIPTALSKQLHDLLPGSQWRTVPGGHACLWESPTSFNAAFIEFLRDHAA